MKKQDFYDRQAELKKYQTEKALKMEKAEPKPERKKVIKSDKCPNCGATVKFDEGACECPYCGNSLKME